MVKVGSRGGRGWRPEQATTVRNRRDQQQVAKGKVESAAEPEKGKDG